MAFFDELKKNLSGVTDTVAKTSENVMKKSSTAIEIQGKAEKSIVGRRYERIICISWQVVF